MFGTIIKFVAETTGQIVGEIAHQIGEVGTAITEIPQAFTDGYDKELFNSKTEQPSEADSDAPTIS